MAGLPDAQHRAVGLDPVDVASLDPDVLHLVDGLDDDRLLHDDGRGLDDHGLLHDDGRGLHDDRGRRGHDRTRAQRVVEETADERAADHARGEAAAVVVVAVVSSWPSAITKVVSAVMV